MCLNILCNTTPSNSWTIFQIGLGSDLQYLRLHDEPCKLVIEDQKSMMVLDGSNDEKPPSYDDVQEGQLLEKPKEAPVEGATSA